MSCRDVVRRRLAFGFSLVEVMIVIVIIGLLAGVATVSVRSYLTKAKQKVARQDVSTLRTALNTWWGEYGSYPTTEQGLKVLAQPSEKLPDPLLENLPNDPWGNAYVYASPGAAGPYDLLSYGADGKPGGDGADADIRNEEADKQ